MSIEAMKMALKAHKKNERHRTVAETRYWCDQYKLLAEQAIAAIAEAEKQEPVAWMIWTHGPVLVFMNKDEAMMEFERRNTAYPEQSRKLRPLYFTPPEAQRKPLTDQQIEGIYDDTPSAKAGAFILRFARAIEAAHGIK